MIELFYQGNPLWMGILTLVLIGAISVAIYKLWNVGEDTFSPEQFTIVKEIGLFAFMLGIFLQAWGLFLALAAIEAATSISPSVLAHGIRVGIIPTLYGLIIYMLSIAFYIGILAYYKRAKS